MTVKTHFTHSLKTVKKRKTATKYKKLRLTQNNHPIQPINNPETKINPRINHSIQPIYDREAGDHI